MLGVLTEEAIWLNMNYILRFVTITSHTRAYTSIVLELDEHI